MASTCAVRLAAAAVALTTASAAVYNAGPDGKPMTIAAALDAAGPGDTIKLADGTYREPIVTKRSGEYGSPLTIEGGRGAVINYFSGDQSVMWSQKVVDIKHSWITLRVRGRESCNRLIMQREGGEAPVCVLATNDGYLVVESCCLQESSQVCQEENPRGETSETFARKSMTCETNESVGRPWIAAGQTERTRRQRLGGVQPRSVEFCFLRMWTAQDRSETAP